MSFEDNARIFREMSNIASGDFEEDDEHILVHSENEKILEHVNSVDDGIEGDSVDDGTEGVDDAIVPTPGMDFKDENEIFEFYKKYARAVGFPVRRRSSDKDDNGIVRYVVLTCSREGGRVSNSKSALKKRATIQNGCKAKVTASMDARGIWRIKTVNLDHNHKTSPSKSRLYRCNRELSAHVKRRLEVNDMAGIPLHKSYNSAVVEAGGYENMTCVEKDCRNYVEKVRRLRFGEGDAVAIQSYFSNMQASCPGFYFSIDLDEESRLRNVFWADNRSIQSYKEFGDVITFDTTYLTNEYDMPFAPFIGVNHHGQSILLGCGLVSNETTETFVWLFKTWLHCMSGQPPRGIITDQDRAMQNAIQIVFPNSIHRWCLWHIMNKLPQKFGYHDNKDAVFYNIRRLVYDSQSAEEFEKGWQMMVDTFNLRENTWQSTMYMNRSRWVPCYLKINFWAGMSTSQRSESMNAFFGEYVQSNISLKRFVEQYERALRDKVEKEFQADFKSFSQVVPCATKFEIEKQFQRVYTVAKFEEVRDEFVGKVYCDIISSVEIFGKILYEVVEDVICDGHLDRKKFSITFQKENCEIGCTCHLFEFRGIICRHAITVLIRNNIQSLPDTYFLRRWRKDVRRAHTRVPVYYAGLSKTAGQMRYEKMCQMFTSLADMTADDDGETQDIIEWIECKKETIRNKRLSNGNCNDMSGPTLESGVSQKKGNIQDPLRSKRKGAPKKKRIKGFLESSSNLAKKKKSNRRQMPQPCEKEDGAPFGQAQHQPP